MDHVYTLYSSPFATAGPRRQEHRQTASVWFSRLFSGSTCSPQNYMGRIYQDTSHSTQASALRFALFSPADLISHNSKICRFRFYDLTGPHLLSTLFLTQNYSVNTSRDSHSPADPPIPSQLISSAILHLPPSLKKKKPNNFASLRLIH